MQNYWQKQTSDKPLFPDLLWSRPENKNQAGKLLIIGGNAHGFAAAGEAYSTAIKAGIGTARVLLPDSLQKTVGRIFDVGEYAPSSPSGSFGQKALAEMLQMSEWADATLLAGDFGRNSETAIVLEKFVDKYSGQLVVTQDAADYFTKQPRGLLQRPETCLVLSFAQLQKLASSSKSTKPFLYESDILHVVENLHEFTSLHKIGLVTKHHDNMLTCFDGRICSTKLTADEPIWRVKTAAQAAVWWLQNPTKTYEALVTSTVRMV